MFSHCTPDVNLLLPSGLQLLTTVGNSTAINNSGLWTAYFLHIWYFILSTWRYYNFPKEVCHTATNLSEDWWQWFCL